jgi:hypothetical protein
MSAYDDAPRLGSCCICNTRAGVTNIVMLPYRCVVKGHGWGCLVCELPNDGAVAVLCDSCIAIYQADHAALRFACRGYPASDGRVPIADLLSRPFDHDEEAHREEDVA